LKVITRRPRSAYVYSDDAEGLVHLPDITVTDHDQPLSVGFLRDRQRIADKPQPTTFDRWREFRGIKG
jgi:hypothetical protein